MEEVGETLSRSSDPNPNHNSTGESADESSLLAGTDADLRVPCYCEENVWRLASRRLRHRGGLVGDGSSPYWVVFVSNHVKNVPMFHQRAASSPHEACCWDYHVVLLSGVRDGPDDRGVAGSGQEARWVWDVDSTLPYPCPLDEYLAQTFPYEWPYPHGPQFRLIEASVYLSTFASNRSHMYNGRTWSSPPPPYDIIQTEADANTLPYLVDFATRRRDETYRRLLHVGALGTILTLPQLQDFHM
jgi:hypothetical protein